MRRLSNFSRAPESLFRFHFASVYGLVLALTFFATSALRAQDQSAASISRQVKDVFERVAKAVVKIHGVDEHREISRLSLRAKNIQRGRFWPTSAAAWQC